MFLLGIATMLASQVGRNIQRVNFLLSIVGIDFSIVQTSVVFFALECNGYKHWVNDRISWGLLRLALGLSSKHINIIPKALVVALLQFDTNDDFQVGCSFLLIVDHDSQRYDVHSFAQVEDHLRFSNDIVELLINLQWCPIPIS